MSSVGYRLVDSAQKRTKKPSASRSLKWIGIDEDGRLERSFFSKVEIPSDQRHCWMWTGSKNASGYGIASVKGKNVAAHRLAIYLFKHDDPKDLLVLHCCDTPACVNPRHLSLGTAHDNVRDLELRERLRRVACERRGEEFVGRCAVVADGDARRLSRVEIDDDVVRSLRWHYWNVTKDFGAIASAHGLTRSRVKNIVRRESWCDVPPIECEFGRVVSWGSWVKKRKIIRGHGDIAKLEQTIERERGHRRARLVFNRAGVTLPTAIQPVGGDQREPGRTGQVEGAAGADVVEQERSRP